METTSRWRSLFRSADVETVGAGNRSPGYTRRRSTVEAEELGGGHVLQQGNRSTSDRHLTCRFD